MTLLIFSDMSTFSVGLILKQLSWHAAVNQFGPFSNSWHVAVNSDIKHTMHGIGVHDVVLHDVGMHDIGVRDVALHDVTVHDVGMSGMAVPSMDVHKT